jgi:hypothetical protein
MVTDLSVSIDPEHIAKLPALRVHLLRFSGSRPGIGSPELDVLRARVLSRARPVIQSYRDLHRVPEVEAFNPLLSELSVAARRELPVHGQLMRLVARQEPFPVQDDARDTANLVSLYYRLPVWLWDPSRLRASLRFGRGDFDGRLQTPEGGREIEGVPTFYDQLGPVGSLLHGVGRGGATESSRQLLAVVLDPGLDGGLDHEALVRRAGNWFQSLAGARLEGSGVSH